MCNINKLQEGYSIGSAHQHAPVDPYHQRNSIYDKVDIYDKARGVNTNVNKNNVNKNSKNSNKNSKNSNKNSVKGVDNYNDIVIPVSPLNYQMGPFDQIVLTTLVILNLNI